MIKAMHDECMYVCVCVKVNGTNSHEVAQQMEN